MFDLCVIGGGWAGFNACLRARELGAKVCLIEQDKIGGVCLHQGCIPTKAMVNSSRNFSHLKDFSNYGIEVKDAQFNFERIQEYKTKIVEKLYNAIVSQLKNKKVELIKAKAMVYSANEVIADNQKINAKYIIIATGSRPIELPSIRFDGQKIVSSNEILELKSIPKKLLIVGGGAIGCEFASIFSSLGTQVTIVELLDRLLPLEDKDISQKIEMVFKKSGIKVLCNTRIEDCALGDFEKVLICVGRAPNVKDLGLEEIGLQTEKNHILVNNFLQTNIPNIYAIGDCVSKKMLAHVASYEALVAIENIFQSKGEANYTAIPNCIFTNPEIGTVGLTEAETQEKGISIKVSKFNFLSSGMAQILGETDGFIKLIADANSQELLGACIIGPKASELIAILTLAIRQRLKAGQIYDTIFAHPTLSEGIFEAAKGLH